MDLEAVTFGYGTEHVQASVMIGGRQCLEKLLIRFRNTFIELVTGSPQCICSWVNTSSWGMPCKKE